MFGTQSNLLLDIRADDSGHLADTAVIERKKLIDQGKFAFPRFRAVLADGGIPHCGPMSDSASGGDFSHLGGM
jgi:hypothetical protein